MVILTFRFLRLISTFVIISSGCDFFMFDIFFMNNKFSFLVLDFLVEIKREHICTYERKSYIDFVRISLLKNPIRN